MAQEMNLKLKSGHMGPRPFAQLNFRLRLL